MSNPEKMVFTLTKEFKFEAAHQLPLHDGKCARLHGHSWRGRVIVAGEDLQDCGPKAGMLIDYGALSALVQPIVESKLDHYHLNESLGLRSPTSERIAAWLYWELAARIREQVDWTGLRLVAVEIDETCTSSCRFEVIPQ